jgi:hypothetical protein
VRDGLVGAATAEATELEALLERTIAAREQAARDASERAARWSDAIREVDEAVAELGQLVGRSF